MSAIRHWAWLLAALAAVSLGSAIEANQRTAALEAAYSDAELYLETFDADITNHFMGTAERRHVFEKAVGEKKPVMVLLVPHHCDACMVLRSSMNAGQHVRQLLPRFVAVHVADDAEIRAWQPEGELNTPQVLFFDRNGTALDIRGLGHAHAHFFGDDVSLAKGMMKALRAANEDLDEELAEEWSEEVAKHFSDVTDRADVMRKAREQGKPVMVLLTTKVSWDSMGLRASVNKGSKVRFLLPHFIVVNQEHDFKQWKEEGHHYIPQALFFNSRGQRISMNSVTAYRNFFADDIALSAAMRKAIHGGTSLLSRSVLSRKFHSPFLKEIVEHFESSSDPEEIIPKAAHARKPAMIILTEPWCDNCKDMIDDINAKPDRMLKLLPQFVVAHASGDHTIEQWKEPGQEYVPQVLFSDGDGNMLDVRTGSKEYPRFFTDEKSVVKAMEQALQLFKRKSQEL